MVIKDDDSTKHNLAHWLLLLHTLGLSRSHIRNLLNNFSFPLEIFKTSTKRLIKYGLKKASIDFIKAPPESGIKVDLEWLKLG